MGERETKKEIETHREREREREREKRETQREILENRYGGKIERVGKCSS